MKNCESTGSRLIDVALGKRAHQSSLSAWSTEGEANRALSGEVRDFAFHTAVEANPWWEVDLLDRFPLDSIVVHNRLATELQARAASLKVETSKDRQAWTLIHQGQVYFGATGAGSPLTLPLGGKVHARYVRLSLAERGCLHLARVSVFVSADIIEHSEVAAFYRYREDYGLHDLKLNNDYWDIRYNLRVNENFRAKDKIVGLSIYYSGRFGNIYRQYLNAIILALKTDLIYIRLADHPLFKIEYPLSVGSLTFLPSSADLPDDGVFLEGVFHLSDPFVPVLPPFQKFDLQIEEEYSKQSRSYLRRHLLNRDVLDQISHNEDELTIHIRSGDIFGSPEEVEHCGGYRQPPLSFYKLIVNKMSREGTIRKVLIVYEDDGNPCIALLHRWLLEQGVPVRLQSASLAEDVAALIDAPHLVFGHGTFGYAICRLSTHIKTLHYFEPELGGRYAFIPGIDRVFAVRDDRGDYIKAGVWDNASYEWRNTPEQRAMMADYPEASLVIEEVGRQHDSAPSPSQGQRMLAAVKNAWGRLRSEMVSAISN